MDAWLMTEWTLLLALAGIPVLALAAIVCLIRCQGKNRKYLVWTTVVFAAVLALFFGGTILLGFFHLAWRNAPTVILLGVLLISGWAGIVLTLACALPAEWPNVPAAVRWAAKGALVLLAALVLVVTLWLGPFAIVFGFGGEERVVEYQGQTLLEVDESWLDPDYRYYEYRGPLVRGMEQIWSGPTHIDGDIN